MSTFLGDAGLFINRVTPAVLSAGDGSYSSSFPIANAGDDELAKVARCTSAATEHTKFRIDLGVARYVRAMWLVFHNLTSAAQWKWLGGTSAGGTEVYPGSFVNVWRFTLEPGFSSIGLEDDGLYDGRRWAACFVLPAFLQARYWDCHISDSGNLAAPQFGRVGLGGGLIPTYGIEVEPVHSQTSLSGRTRAALGAEWKTRRPIQRGADIAFRGLTATEGVTVRHLNNLVNTTEGVFYAPSISDLETTQREGFYGTLTELAKVGIPLQHIREADLRITEQLP